MSRPREPRPPRPERAEKLHSLYLTTPLGIEDVWSEATSRAVIPDGARDRFRSEHPAISTTGLRRVEQGLLQWVRIEGRSPGTHELPSRAVESLWKCLRCDEEDWEVFRESLGIEMGAGLDAGTYWIPDDDSEPMRATWSDAFDDELPLTGHPTLFILDDEVGIAETSTAGHAIDPHEQDPAPSPDTFDIYEPPETDPVPGAPAGDTPAWERPPWDNPSGGGPRWETPRWETPSGVQAAVARLAPPLPSLRTDGLRAVLRERRERSTRALLDGWAVLTAHTTMPPGLDARFTEQFPEVATERVAVVWDAFLQWLRIEGRKYPTRHAMPSRSVEALVGMLRSDQDTWNSLRAGWPVNLDHLFVRPRGLWMPGDDKDLLRETWTDAFVDEPPKSGTPLLFRVDASVGIRNGCSYQPF